MAIIKITSPALSKKYAIIATIIQKINSLNVIIYYKLEIFKKLKIDNPFLNDALNAPAMEERASQGAHGM